MTEKTIAIILAILFVAAGGAAVYYRQDCQSLKEQLATAVQARQESQTQLEAGQAEIEKLRQSARLLREGSEDAQVAELEKQLAERERELAELRERQPRRPGGDGRRPGGPGGGRRPPMGGNREGGQRGGGMRQRMEERNAKMDAFFNSLDTSRMTETQKQLIDDYNTVRQQIASGEGSFDTMRTLFEMNGQVREALLENLGQGLGLDGTELSAKVQEILDVTGGGFMPMMPGGGPGGPGGGPGGPGGPGPF